MSPLLWRSRSHLFLNPFLLPPITFVYISPFYHHAPVSSPKVLTNCLFSPYSETADFNHDGALLHSHPKSTAADKIYQRYILTCLPRRHIQNEDFNPARDEDSSHHVTFLCTMKFFVSLALKDEPQVQLHQKLPPPEDPERHTHTLQEDHRYHPK